jgi:drug/metabolite transporter (DMT)-like permease
VSKGVKYIIISTVFFSLMNIGVKYLPHIPAWEIAFFRALVSGVICYGLLKRAGLQPWGTNRRVLIFRGLAGTAGLVMYFYTLQHMPLASAITIQLLSPIFTIILAGLLLREPPRPIQWLFFLLSFAGVVMIKGFDPRVSLFDLGMGISAAVMTGLAYNFVRQLRSTDHHLVVVLFFPLVAVPITGSMALVDWVMPTPFDLAILLAIGIVVTVAQIYMTKGYQADRASNISNFNYLQVIYGLVLGYLLFNESVGWLAMLGIVFIVAGVLLSSRFRSISETAP